MLQLVINGARGRMGRLVRALATDDERFRVVACLGRDDHDDAPQLAPRDVDVVIDFSSDEGARCAAALAQRTGAALLVGTTALSAKTLDRIEVSARSAPVMIAPNTSRGIAVMNHIVTETARLLGTEFCIDLVEYHHAAKRDAPSGTARRILDSLRDQAGVEVPPEHVHSIRAGDIPGEHQVEFTGPAERLKIFHLVAARDVFARGALNAAAWLADRPAGRHTLEQSLGLE
jgi:4-hydroxy-tetrahydrodipicolinate reductase